MFNRIRISLVSTALFAAFCLLLSSCSNDENEPASESFVTLKVMLPEDKEHNVTPTVRAGTPEAGDPDESKISSLMFIVYKDANTLEFAPRTITIADNGTSTDPMWDATNKTLRLTLTPGTKQIYCIANYDAAGMPTIDATSASTVTKLLALERNHNAIALVNPPVMVGSRTDLAISGSETTPFTISLRRQIARVEIYPKLSPELVTLGAKVTVNGVKFSKLAQKAYIYAKSPVASPSTAVWNQTAYSGVTSAQLTGTAVKYGTVYYIPERVPSPANEANATVMTVQATYNTQTVEYNVVINPAVSATPTGHSPFVIERNHIYRYYLTIQGKPSTTRGDSSLDGGGITYELDIK